MTGRDSKIMIENKVFLYNYQFNAFISPQASVELTSVSPSV